MVHIPAASLCIDAYEASRGEGDAARSATGADPWTELSWVEANDACEAAGKRLCSAEEWMTACMGPHVGEETTYPYGATYGDESCNGQESGIGRARPTGSLEGCEGGYPGLFDMSGNVEEYTSTCEGFQCHYHGGNFESDRWGLRCRAYFAPYVEGARSSLGFRCCREAAPVDDPDPGPEPGECPSDMVRIPDRRSCIDRYEASSGPSGGAESVVGATPWTNLGFDDARLACTLAGKHLCTGSEWTAACGGAEASEFPYGGTYEEGRCNAPIYGADAPLPTGSLGECEGGLPGLFDMSGNVTEWNESYDDCPSGYFCPARGGSYSSMDQSSLSCSSNFELGGSAPDVGFRCCLYL
jgi:formylglycine-generating enzyme required for sulfatase activity